MDWKLVKPRSSIVWCSSQLAFLFLNQGWNTKSGMRQAWIFFGVDKCHSPHLFPSSKHSCRKHSPTFSPVDFSCYFQLFFTNFPMKTSTAKWATNWWSQQVDPSRGALRFSPPERWPNGFMVDIFKKLRQGLNKKIGKLCEAGNHEGDWRRDSNLESLIFFFYPGNQRAGAPEKPSGCRSWPWNLLPVKPQFSGMSIAMEVWMVTCLLMFTYQWRFTCGILWISMDKISNCHITGSEPSF